MKENIKKFLFQNSTVKQTVLKNTFWMSFGQLASRGIRAVVIIYAARILGAAGYGVFAYALSLAGFFSIFSDIGIGPFLTREVSRNPELREQYIATSFVLKFILILVNSFIILFTMPLVSHMPEAASLFPIVVVLFAFDNIRDFCFVIMRSLEKMELEAGISIFTNAAMFALGIVALFLNPTAFTLMVVYTIGSGLGMIFAVWKMRKYFSNLISSFNKTLIKPTLTQAWPFGVAGLLSVVMLNTDTLMLGWMKSSEDVGLYSAAQRIILILYMLPGFVATSTFPVLSRLAKENTELFKKIFEKTLRAVFLTVLPIVCGGILLAGPITIFIFGNEYAQTATALGILLFALLFVFPGTIVNNGLFAFNKQKYLMYSFAFGSIGNIILNAILIPKYGISGASVATIITQLISNGYTIYMMRKTIPFKIFQQLPKIAIATLFMCIGIIVIKLTNLHVVFEIITGIIIYFGILYLIKEDLLVHLKSQFSEIINNKTS